MNPTETTPRPGDELISGWIVERQVAAAPEATDEYDIEIWVTPKA